MADASRQPAPPPHHSVKTRLTQELKRFLILFVYLWVLLGLFVLNQDLIERSAGNVFVFQGFAILNAVILAKVMLAAEYVDVARWLQRLPVAATIAFEAALCTALFMTVHVIERVLVGLFHGSTLAASIPSFGGGGLAGTVIVAAIMFVSLLPFFTFKHVARAIGSDRLRAILFQRRDPANPAPE
jgi:hypothetical protein